MEEGDKRRCPGCGRLWWGDPQAAFADRCPSCGGHHLRPHLVQQILGDELGFAPADLRARAQEAGGHAAHRGGCAACEAQLVAVPIEDVVVDICLRCGSAWFDPGELEQLSQGRHREKQAPGGIARQYLPDAVAPDGAHRFVRVPPSSLTRSLGGAALIGAGLIGFWFPIIPMVALGVGGVVAYQRGAVFDLLERRAASVTSFVIPMRGTWHDWDAFQRVNVEARVAGRGSNGPEWRFTTRLVGELATLEIVRTKHRVLAHRYAFQVSQIVGVPVEHPRQLES